MTNKDLDELALDQGVPMDGTEELFVEEKKTEQLDKISSKLNDYVYGGAGPIPGESISAELDAITHVDKGDAMDTMIMQSAMLKAQKEREDAERKLTAKEKAERREQVINYLLYQQEEEYFKQHKFIMDGKTKRRLRSKIARDYDKGRLRIKKGGKSLND